MFQERRFTKTWISPHSKPNPNPTFPMRLPACCQYSEIPAVYSKKIKDIDVKKRWRKLKTEIDGEKSDWERKSERNRMLEGRMERLDEWRE